MERSAEMMDKERKITDEDILELIKVLDDAPCKSRLWEWDEEKEDFVEIDGQANPR